MASRAATRRRAKRAAAALAGHARLHRAMERSTASALLRRFYPAIIPPIVAAVRLYGVNGAPEQILPKGSLKRPFNAAMAPAWMESVVRGIGLERSLIGGETAQAALLGITQAADEGRWDKLRALLHVDMSHEQAAAADLWLSGREVGVWSNVEASVRANLQATLREAITKGYSPRDAEAAVRKVLTNYSRVQARRVARTETTGSLNFGGQLERDDAEIPGKVWISTIDNRNRGAKPGKFNHLQPDGQVVLNSEPFVVSKQLMMYPGDISLGATAGNVINCRCAATADFSVEKRKRGPRKPRVKKEPKLPGLFPEDPEQLELVRPLGGSTGAELVKDKLGALFVRKRGANPGHLREEFAAEAAYRVLGVPVPESKLYDGARPVKLSRFIEGKPLGSLTGDARKQAVRKLSDDYAADALLGNWDVVGLGQDNVLVDAAGVPWRIDVGGSLRYRAQGALKTSQQWNGYVTELWSLADGQGSAAQAYKGLSFADRIVSGNKLLKSLKTAKKQEAFLATVDAPVADVLKKRLANLEDVVTSSQEFFEDDWLTDYVSDVQRHRVGLQMSGISARMPKLLKPASRGSVRLVDENGRHFDHLRGRDSIMSHFAQYVEANGGSRATLERWASGQAGSSWSAEAQATKVFFARQRRTDITEYFWKEGFQDGMYDARAGFNRSFRYYEEQVRAVGENVYKQTFAANHAFQYELLMNTDIPNVNRKKRLMKLMRTENSRSIERAYKITLQEGQDGVKFARGVAESTSLVKPVYVYGDTLCTQEVPFTRLIGNYFSGRGYDFSESFFMGDSENEFVAILEGIPMKVAKKGRRR